jgi:hypothetical protein
MDKPLPSRQEQPVRHSSYNVLPHHRRAAAGQPAHRPGQSGHHPGNDRPEPEAGKPSGPHPSQTDREAH